MALYSFSETRKRHMRDDGRREEKRTDWLVVQLGIAHRKISHGGRFAKEKGEKAALLKANNSAAHEKCIWLNMATFSKFM